MKKKFLAPMAAAGLLLGSVAMAAPALAAAPTGPSAQIVGVVHLIDAHTAVVQAQYRCASDDPAQDPALHLWVSVKQSANGTADPALAGEGTGFGGQLGGPGATAWAQSHAVVQDLVCDGRTHVGKFTVNQDEPAFDEGGNPVVDENGHQLTVGFGSLQRGDAYVQFCLFDKVGYAGSMEFVHVR